MRSIENFVRALRIAIVLLALAAAFSLLIMGIFAAVFDTSTVRLVGMGIALGGLGVLLLMVLARLALRSHHSAGLSRDRRTYLIMCLIACVGGATLTFVAWQELRLYVQRPSYQEAAIEPPAPSAF